jgi:Oxidoreductase molybdopterin binding domain
VAERNDRWGWTRAAGWGRIVPPGHSGATASGRASGKCGGARYLNGMPLTPEHGAPLRLVAPARTCFYSVKWVERLEVLADAVPTTGETIARTRLQR